MDVGFLLIVVVAVLLGVFLPWLSDSKNGRANHGLAALQAQLQEWVQSSAARQLSIDPERYEAVSAELAMHRRIESGDVRSLTTYILNTKGQYVMVLVSLDTDQPYVKVVEDRIARIVLRERYKAPET
ncbi:hypothetical protein KIK84_05020 [Curvibacter sp. CHRR-16]|uniref:hypothetical protein n=1 Tax=Curvibacter sp. CHRR-16 TaxID=2835872 RepID=UPI001BDAD26B|nr:hypothetical protein [Curvibacter sp. CHRR-16]MBT0569676.1 hypothetical protein [Curvibacter sp. CHRR-16]